MADSAGSVHAEGKKRHNRRNQRGKGKFGKEDRGGPKSSSASSASPPCDESEDHQQQRPSQQGGRGGGGGSDSGGRRRRNFRGNKEYDKKIISSRNENSDASNGRERVARQPPSLSDLETASLKTNGRRKPPKKVRKDLYPPHLPYADCLGRYAANDKTLVRGKIRVMPKKDGLAFVSCDRGSLCRDVVIEDAVARNRALDGDYVFVELLPPEDQPGVGDRNENNDSCGIDSTLADCMGGLKVGNEAAPPAAEEEHTTGCDAEDLLSPDDFEDYDIGGTDEDFRRKLGGGISSQDESEEEEEVAVPTWRDDNVQKRLWDPAVNIRKLPSGATATSKRNGSPPDEQHKGRVVYVIPPKVTAQPSELNPGRNERNRKYNDAVARRTIVGTLTNLPGANSNRCLFVPNQKSLPRFMCPFNTKKGSRGLNGNHDDNADHDDMSELLYRAEYIYGSWSTTDRWPPCVNVKPLGSACNVSDETTALLAEFGVDHGEFQPPVLRDVERAVKSGRILPPKHSNGNRKEEGAEDLGWRPTPSMYQGRRDYRKERIFTIDPTTAKDLDDALHIKPLPSNRVEIGVHIADVSFFVKPDTSVDQEAERRATTVYLVDRTVPMLPRPLCEIACSLNENVERLAFSCVWTMNLDGTLEKQQETDGSGGKRRKRKADKVWYGRTVIKSCARLDYATAQNIIENKVATGERPEDVNEALWPRSRQPTGGHTIDAVAADVRLMHRVAQARRALRFQSGALALNGIKLAFILEDDGETPILCAPYPIWDSNRLVEEYMLLANYLVAQRLITHAGGLALLRNHAPPLQVGLQNVVDIARESICFHIDTSSSRSLQESLSRLGRECNDDLVLQCVTELIMTPMQPATYIAAGELDECDWRHFALNIPYYTHFTSPIRRYADILVHRLLQATIDGPDAVDEYPQSQTEIHSISSHCNDKRMASKRAQERSDRVFLSLFLKNKPIERALGIVLSVGEKTFTVFVPSLGLNTLVFLEEHNDIFDSQSHGEAGKRRIVLTPKQDGPDGEQRNRNRGGRDPIEIRIFTKLAVSCHCKEKPPIDVSVKVMGLWHEGGRS